MFRISLKLFSIPYSLFLRICLFTFFFTFSFGMFAFAATQLSISTATASSSYSTTYSASKATDNNLTTYWRGASNKAPWWLRLDLGKNSSLYQLSISWDKSFGSTNYNIQVSVDNKTWTNVFTTLSSSGGATNPYTLTHKLSGSYRYVRIYINRAQNTYPIIYETKLYADTAPPAGTIKINSGAQYTNSGIVALTLLASDPESGLSQMQFSNNNTTYSAPEGFATAKSWTLVSGDGAKTVYVKYKDAAGNWSAPASAGIILDTILPKIIIDSPKDGAFWQDSEIQLQGTVDGVGFSESRTLMEGENVLTKVATDAAGNSSSVSIKVYKYTGTLIGPQGGEVISSDGKVKLVIPQGALAETRGIEISKVSNEGLQNAAPSGSSLLSVVECKPTGLSFLKPVKLIYTLDQPEVPGTPVELGFYDSVQKKIVSTGETSTVAADGISITCDITHFSMYAALKNMVSQGAPIGSGVQIPLPDLLTGAFGHAIPISVSPGRRGMQPSLALNYRSSGPNSWVGCGFSLNPGYIVRSTRLGPPSYDDAKDTFYFMTDAGATELVHLIDNLYQAKIESAFTKFYKETDDSWKVVAKDGNTLWFGQSADSREGSASGGFAWYLTKAEDTNGNFMTYSYIKDSGKSYLSRIDYAGHESGVAATNSVEFILEPRDDAFSSYISTAKIETNKRLKEIVTKVSGEIVWRYVLNYSTSPDTGRSMLMSVTTYGADGQSLPVQKLEYQKGG